MIRKYGCVSAMLLLLPVLSLGSAWGAESAKAASAVAVKEQRALDLLKGMSDRLAAAKSFSFKARDFVEAPGGTGQLLTFFAESEVAVVRPDKLRVKVGGDAPPFDLSFDGKTLSVYAPREKLYASADAPKTLDELLPFAAKAGVLLPYADFLFKDPYAVLTKDITSAFYAGSSIIGGVRCEHLAVASPGVEWQIWIDAKSHLPRLLTGALLTVQGMPRFAVELSDWRLDPKLPAKGFVLTKPAGANRMELRIPTGQ